eukprot:scaffold100_cov357-Prasinococcus_capsulatus_cf.AAC.5
MLNRAAQWPARALGDWSLLNCSGTQSHICLVRAIFWWTPLPLLLAARLVCSTQVSSLAPDEPKPPKMRICPSPMCVAV